VKPKCQETQWRSELVKLKDETPFLYARKGFELMKMKVIRRWLQSVPPSRRIVPPITSVRHLPRPILIVSSLASRWIQEGPVW